MNNTIKPYISVIIPVYNTGAYLAASLESVINQTLTNIEIIVVNDGSTDNSPEIINIYKERDSRILVINQANSGLSMARNSGLKMASGEFIYFMDSDDLIDPGTLLTCYEFAAGKGLDLVCFDAQSFFDEDFKDGAMFKFDYSRSDILSKGIYSGRDFLVHLVKGNGYKASVCLYIAKKELLDELSLLFYEGIFHEDELFTPQLILNANKVGYLPFCFFKRRMRYGSIMQKAFSQKNLISYITVVKELINSTLIKASDWFIVDKIIVDILNVVSYRSNSLGVKVRMGLFFFLIKRGFIIKIRLKNLMVLVFPILIRVKLLLKK
ncbi:MAG: glycosyltransferase [Bacteroidales bacterium]